MQADGELVYNQSFKKTHEANSLQSQYENLVLGAVVPDLQVKVAGRVRGKRAMGKAIFLDIEDSTVTIQAIFSFDVIEAAMGEGTFKRIDRCDIGDILGVAGSLRRTKRGELSVDVTQYQVLTKALRPIPDLLTDVEKRLRQRHLDLIVNPGIGRTLKLRSQITSHIRNFFDNRGFLEIETPILLPEAGGADAKPFETHHNALDIPMFLRIATELHLKRLVIGGFDKVYEIGRIFRNEGTSTRHNPEFTSIEVYQAYADYLDIMQIAEDLIRDCAQTVLGKQLITYQGIEIDLSIPFRQVKMRDLVLEVTQTDFGRFTDLDEAKNAALIYGIEMDVLDKILPLAA
jgi:lysyl-tRNA synthetase, class II